MVAVDLGRHNMTCQIQGRPDDLVLANWTQPRFRRLQRGGAKVWTPAGKGWVDLGLFYRGGHIQVDLKAVHRGVAKYKYRWALDPKLRRDQSGHQIATLDTLTSMGHRAGVLLGAWHEDRLQPWELFLVPVAGVDFARPSIPWDEVSRYAVDRDQWWLET